MNFIDMHIHLQDYKSTIAKNIVSEAQKAGVKKLLCTSIIESDWKTVSVYSSTYPNVVVPAFGLHPWYLDGAESGWEDRISSYFIEHPEALVGETGLDGLKETLMATQKKVFETHIELAKRFKRPLIIHAVRAGQIMDEYWDKLPPKFMFHSYNSSYEQLYHINKLGGYVSFSHSIMSNKDKEKVLQAVPADKILVETDGPYQSGKKDIESKPTDLPELVKFIAEVRGDDLTALAEQIYHNSEEFLK